MPGRLPKMLYDVRFGFKTGSDPSSTARPFYLKSRFGIAKVDIA
jgi:hypothetical protein